MITRKEIAILAFGRPSRRTRIRARRAAVSCRRSGEAGYTLLFAVFLAASMLIMLSIVSLKITTQGQREAEEEMIWRGHQYERGIQRYVQKFGRYPSKIDDLVKATSGVRYMREAYKDPMNKEDGSWRFIYVTPAGQLIGSVRYTSLVQMALMDKMASMGGSMNAMGAIPGTSPLNGNAASSFGNSSGFGSPGGFGSSNSGFGNSNSGFGGGSNGFGNQGSSGFGQQGNQGSNQNNRQQNQNQSGNQDNSGDNSGNGNSGGNPTGNSNGNSFGGQNSGGGQNGLGGGGSSAFGIGGANGQQSGSAFGFSSDQNGGSSPLGQMSVLGGSITGVGSKIEKPSLMVYKRAKKYKEWEFIYNPIEQQQQAAQGIGGGGGVGIGQPAGGQGLGGSTFGAPGGGMGGRRWRLWSNESILASANATSTTAATATKPVTSYSPLGMASPLRSHWPVFLHSERMPLGVTVLTIHRTYFAIRKTKLSG